MSDDTDRTAVETVLAANPETWYAAEAMATATGLTLARADAFLRILTSGHRAESRMLEQFRRWHPGPRPAGEVQGPPGVAARPGRPVPLTPPGPGRVVPFLGAGPRPGHPVLCPSLSPRPTQRKPKE